MRRELTRSALTLLFPLVLVIGCDPGGAPRTNDLGTEDPSSDGTEDPSGGGATAENPSSSGTTAPGQSCIAYFDDDGDGAFRVDDSGCPEGVEDDRIVEDCDDTDPDVLALTTYYQDIDGDGYGDANGETMPLCEGTVVEGFVSNGDDCAPKDRARQLELYRDADHDGVGLEPECVAATSPEHVLLPGDCNDADPSIVVGGRETPLDGVDSDCDGDDEPLLACGGSMDIELPAGVSCTGTGLAILARSECLGCSGGSGTFVIVNLGTESSPESTLRVSPPGQTEDELTLPPLAPGETHVTERVPLGSEVVIELPAGTPNCAPAQNTRGHIAPHEEVRINAC